MRFDSPFSHSLSLSALPICHVLFYSLCTRRSKMAATMTDHDKSALAINIIMNPERIFRILAPPLNVRTYIDLLTSIPPHTLPHKSVVHFGQLGFRQSKFKPGFLTISLTDIPLDTFAKIDIPQRRRNARKNLPLLVKIPGKVAGRFPRLVKHDNLRWPQFFNKVQLFDKRSR